jgi:hypothetical protein
VTYGKEKPTEKNVKIKNNQIVGPGTYKDLDKGLTITRPSSQQLKFKTDKRIVFAEAAGKRKQWVPSPDKYPVDKMKHVMVYKRITTRRH